MPRREILDRIEKFIDPYRVTKGKAFRLKDFDPGDTRNIKSDRKEEAKEMLAQGVEWLAEEQDKLYPQGCQVYSFKQPSSEDLDHDFLWRYVKCLPERGRIGIFNRSYYEEVLVVRVHEALLERQKLPRQVVGKRIWEERLRDIAAFEDYLTRQGTIVLKFFLHVSRKEQKKRFMERLDQPEKNWKFSSADVQERQFWNDYMAAFEDAIRATAAKHAPWFVVPADNKWFTRLVVAAAIVEAMERLDLEYPKIDAAKRRELAAARAALSKEK
jgi:PPK2 family polyphosphate:nucleotide phosphotransferase